MLRRRQLPRQRSGILLQQPDSDERGMWLYWRSHQDDALIQDNWASMFSLTTNPLQLPAGCVQTSCVFDTDAWQSVKFSEAGLMLPARLATAIPKRKSEFLAGRYCAQMALKKMGVDCPHTIAIGENRAPCWPDGTVGSITHSRGFASAIVAPSGLVRSIGIDSEALIAEKTANNVSGHILTDQERHDASTGLLESDRHYLTLVFSAKESIFKCLYPLVQQYFDFRHARVELDPDRPGHFDFQLLKDLGGEFRSGYAGSGYYTLNDDFIHTAVVLPR